MQRKNSIIEYIIDEAREGFISGQKLNKRFNKSLPENAALMRMVRRKSYMLGHFECNVQWKDSTFPTYNANRIVDTNFIAACGPKFATVAKFLANTVFNAELPIREIIALGGNIAVDAGVKQADFFDYCIGKNESASFTHATNGQGELYRVDISSSRLQSTKTAAGMTLFHNHHKEDSHHIIQSELRVNLSKSAPDSGEGHAASKTINVTLIPVQDGGSIVLNKPDHLQIFWDLFVKSLQEPIVVHCQAGVGRTGHLILTLELLKYYNGIFSQADPVNAAKYIHCLLARLRESRIGLVWTEEQFTSAIRNACALYQFALSRGYIEKGEPVYESALMSDVKVREAQKN